MGNLSVFGEYIVIGIAMLTGAIVYVTILRGGLRIGHKVPSPFNFDKYFWREFKKFGTMYLLGDIGRLVIEGFVVGFPNAILLRVIAMILTVMKGGFFGWFRNLMVEAFHKTGAKTTGLRKYIGDTISSLIFWFPIYIIQLFVLYAFQLITMQKIFLAIIVALVITLIFGRFSCFLADLFEKYILHKKPQHTYVDPLGEFGFKTK